VWVATDIVEKHLSKRKKNAADRRSSTIEGIGTEPGY
jgi:hypothetical protein